MTEKEGGPTADPGDPSKPTEADRNGSRDEMTGKEAAKGEKPPTSGRDRSEAAIDLDTAHDRAS